MKFLTILGVRPQFIKVKSVSLEIVKHKEIEGILVHTGQYYDVNISDIFFDEIPMPKLDYFLRISGKFYDDTNLTLVANKLC